MLPRGTVQTLPFAMLLLAHGISTSPAIDFARDVQPVLAEHCYQCHGEVRQKSGLRLDSKAAALKGGDKFGPDIVPGSASASRLIQMIRGTAKGKAMPPEGDRLSARKIKVLSDWIDLGAVWPDGIDAAVTEDRSNHWSFKPLPTVIPASTTS